MGATKGEEGMLKLVHPGRYVEIHTKPITAAEVLKRNHRHSVTRPDVFEYPWIVIRPESLLKLGRVYYIVPNRTIYKLIKAKGYSVQPSSKLQHEATKRPESRRQLEEPSPSKLAAGETPKHQGHCQSEWQQFQASSQEESFGESFDRSSQFELMSVTGSMSEPESPDGPDEVSCSFAPALGNASKTQATILRPCLRKPDSTRKLLHLRVSFSLPTNCEERKRQAIDPISEYPFSFTS